MTQIVTVDLVNGTANDAAGVNAIATAVKAVVNGNLDDGNIVAGANIAVSKLAPGSANQVLTTSGGVAVWAAPAASASGPPAGSILMYGAAAAPTGYLLCNGAAVSRATYADLFAAIGTTYGAGDGSTTFNVPDFVGRVPVGLSSSGPALINGLGDNDGVSVNNRNISHRHSYTNSTNTAMQASGATGAAANVSAFTSGDSNNTDYPAFLVVNYIVKT